MPIPFELAPRSTTCPKTCRTHRWLSPRSIFSTSTMFPHRAGALRGDRLARVVRRRTDGAAARAAGDVARADALNGHTPMMNHHTGASQVAFQRNAYRVWALPARCCSLVQNPLRGPWGNIELGISLSCVGPMGLTPLPSSREQKRGEIMELLERAAALWRPHLRNLRHRRRRDRYPRRTIRLPETAAIRWIDQLRDALTAIRHANRPPPDRSDHTSLTVSDPSLENIAWSIRWPSVCARMDNRKPDLPSRKLSSRIRSARLAPSG